MKFSSMDDEGKEAELMPSFGGVGASGNGKGEANIDPD